MIKFKEALEKLESLRKTSKRNEKKALLKEFLKDEFFKKIVKYALDSSYHYNINSIPEFSKHDVKFGNNIEEDFFKYLDYLRFKKGATDIDRDAFNDILSYDESIYEIGKIIINKDLKAGTGAKTINAAMKDMLEIFPYMQCSSISKLNKINFPCEAQKKENGFFMALIKKGDKIFHRTRNGQYMNLCGNFVDEFPTLKNDFAIIGECVVIKDGECIDRSSINGYATKAIEGTLTKEESDELTFVVWDLIDYNEFYEKVKSKQKLKERFGRLEYVVDYVNNPNIKLIEHKTIDNITDLHEYYLKNILRGHEGIVVKDFSNVWKNGKSTSQVKYKNNATCELRVKSWNYGEEGKKYQYCMATFTCYNDEGTVEVNVGTGFPDKFRGFLGLLDGVPIKGMDESARKILDGYIDNIIEVKYSSVTKDVNKDTYSLEHPVYMDKRFDKNETDTLETIKEQLKSPVI